MSKLDYCQALTMVRQRRKGLTYQTFALSISGLSTGFSTQVLSQ